MKPGLILASVALAAALAAVIWQGSVAWKRDSAQRAAMVNPPLKPVVIPPAVPMAAAAPVSAVQYADVAEKNLFSKDRNPNVVIEQKPQEEKKMPALPSLWCGHGPSLRAGARIR